MPPLAPGVEEQWGVILFALRSLFNLIECRYPLESKRTRYYLREFLFQLKNTYTSTLLTNTIQEKPNQAVLRRLHSKIIFMIQQLQHTLAV